MSGEPLRQSASADQQELLELAVEAARMAGALLAERFSSGAERSVASKSTPTDLVSEADIASQRAIRELLSEHRPEDGFLGEEEDSAADGRSGLRWVVDPLDGTVNYLFGIPQWSISVAVDDEHGTLAGVVYDPSRDELFSATLEGPARLAGPSGTFELGLQVAVSDRDRRGAAGAAAAGGSLSDALVATGLGYDSRVRAAQAKVLARLIPHVRDIRRFGSAALDLSWTAAGRFDAYFERTVKPWDIAAGALICQRAGLAIRDLPVHENLPWGILAAPPALAESLLALVCDP